MATKKKIRQKSKGPPKIGRLSKYAYVRKYLRERPPKTKRGKAQATARAVRIWEEQRAPSYPRFTQTLEREGLSHSEAMHYSRRFHALNKAYYHERDHPARIVDLEGHRVLKSQAQARDEWLMRFEDLWEEALGDSFAERSEIYPQES